MPTNQNHFSLMPNREIWTVSSFVVIVLAIVLIGFYVLRANRTKDPSQAMITNSSGEGEGALVTNSSSSITAVQSWKEYRSDDFRFTVQIPSDWSIEPFVMKNHPSFAGEVKTTRFFDPKKTRSLEIGIRHRGETYFLTTRMYFYVDEGNYLTGDTLSIAGIDLPTTLQSEAGKVKSWFLGSSSEQFPVVGDRELYAEYKSSYPLSDTETFKRLWVETDLAAELPTVRRIVSSIEFF